MGIFQIHRQRWWRFMWPWVWDVLDRIDDPNLLKIDGSTTNPQNFASFWVRWLLKEVNLTFTSPWVFGLCGFTAKAPCSLRDLGISGAQFGGFSWKWTLLPAQQVETLKTYKSATLPLIQLVCHGSCGVCIFILVYLHHNEQFHMNGAREPFLFANSLEGWDTAQFDSNRFLLLVEKLESYPCFAPTHLANYSVFFWLEKKLWSLQSVLCWWLERILLMTWKNWTFAIKKRSR